MTADDTAKAAGVIDLMSRISQDYEHGGVNLPQLQRDLRMVVETRESIRKMEGPHWDEARKSLRSVGVRLLSLESKMVRAAKDEH